MMSFFLKKKTALGELKRKAFLQNLEIFVQFQSEHLKLWTVSEKEGVQFCDDFDFGACGEEWGGLSLSVLLSHKDFFFGVMEVESLLWTSRGESLIEDEIRRQFQQEPSSFFWDYSLFYQGSYVYIYWMVLKSEFHHFVDNFFKKREVKYQFKIPHYFFDHALRDSLDKIEKDCMVIFLQRYYTHILFFKSGVLYGDDVFSLGYQSLMISLEEHLSLVPRQAWMIIEKGGYNREGIIQTISGGEERLLEAESHFRKGWIHNVQRSCFMMKESLPFFCEHIGFDSSIHCSGLEDDLENINQGTLVVLEGFDFKRDIEDQRPLELLLYDKKGHLFDNERWALPQKNLEEVEEEVKEKKQEGVLKWVLIFFTILFFLSAFIFVNDIKFFQNNIKKREQEYLEMDMKKQSVWEQREHFNQLLYVAQKKGSLSNFLNILDATSFSKIACSKIVYGEDFSIKIEGRSQEYHSIEKFMSFWSTRGFLVELQQCYKEESPPLFDFIIKLWKS